MELVLNLICEGNGARTGLILSAIMGGWFVGGDEDVSKINVILLSEEWKYAVQGISK